MLNTVIKQLEVTASVYKDKVAIRDEKAAVKFCEYRNISRIVATNLCNLSSGKGVIAVYLPKSFRCLEVLMGILYSGHCYCPIPFGSPNERAEMILKQLQPCCIITDQKNHDVVMQFVPQNIPIILEESLIEGICNDKLIDEIISRVIDTDPAYVLFTSGSTGIPKGVVIPHRAIIDYIQWSVEHFDLDESTILASQAPFHFDASMPDIYTPVFTGAELVLVDEKLFIFPPKLIQYLNDMRVNTLIWVPSALMVMTNRNVFHKYKLQYLKLVMFCGEVMPVRHLNIWKKYNPQVMFVNLYGPTESAYASTFYIINREFKDDEALPIGQPCTNTDIILLDENDNEVSDAGEIGEICIRGSSLALGYYANRENRSFIQNPQNSLFQDIIYRTGDLGRINVYKELMYIGRKDTQIKHMGYRIELGEVEIAAASVRYVKAACALYDSSRNIIVLFYQVSQDYSLEKFIDELSVKLPSYMLPNKYRKVENMPYNLNGKIDRVYLRTLLESEAL